ncbi:MAG: hypothetical protein Q7J54_00200 [Candidatus Woesearchaeota archaeon]|nr:hypothetical protein [Candidatus Woesearchaeota archaeon]
MFLKKWRKSVFILILIVTNVILILIAKLNLQPFEYVNYIILKGEKSKYLEFLKEDGQVFVGVIMPNNILSGDTKEDHKHAKAFLTDDEDNLWQYVRTENEPLGYKYKIFVFEALPINERLTSR